MKVLTKFILLLTAIGIPRFAMAQIPEKLSLQEAIDYAVQHSWAMKQANQDVDIAKAKVWETITDGLPQVSASSDYTKFIDPQLMVLSDEAAAQFGASVIPVSQNYSSNWGINASQLIFDGSYLVGLKASKVYVNLSSNAAIKSRLTIAKATEEAYYNVLIAKENLNLLQNNLSILETQLNETKAQNAAGFVEELDVDRINLSVKRSASDIQQAERSLKVSFVVLNYILGINDMDASIVLTDKLESLIVEMGIEPATSSFDYTQHIDYVLLQNQWKAQDLLMRNVVAGNLPKISAFYNYSKNAYGNDWNLFSSDNKWYKMSVVGLNLTVPIIGFGKMWSKAKQAKLERSKIDQQLEETQLRINRDLLMALTTMQSAKETYLNEKENLALAQKIYNTAQIKYKNGVGKSIELIQGEQEYLKSQKAYINAISNLSISKILLDKALSKL